MAEERLRIVFDEKGAAGVRGSLKSVEGAMSALQSSAARVAGVLGIGSLGAAFVAMTKASIDSASKLVDSADKIGISTKAYQELGYAAKQSGVDQEAFDVALSKLSVNISKAADGTGAAADTFAALGISVKDSAGSMRPTEEVLADIADRFQNLKNPADRARVAVELFGKSGVPLVNMLRDGGAGLREYAAAAQRLGVVLDEQSARELEGLGDELDTLGAQIATARDLIVAGMLPALKWLADEAMRAASGWHELLSGFSETKRLKTEEQIADIRRETALLQMELTKLANAKSTASRIDENTPFGSSAEQERVLRIRNQILALKQREMDLEAQLPKPPPPRERKDTGLEFDPEEHKKQKKESDQFAKEIEQLRETAARSTAEMAGLVLDEFAGARTAAAFKLSESMREIERIEAQAVEAAKGSVEKIRLARETAQQAELAAVARFEAEKTSITKREATAREEAESKRQTDLERFVRGIPAEASPDLYLSQAKQSALDLQQILTEGLGNALSAFGEGAGAAFEDFIFGTKSAAEAFRDFAQQTLRSIADLLIQMAVMAAVQKVIGLVSGTGNSNLDAFLASIPGAASGGIVTRPTLSLIGEAGEPEAIVPLSKAGALGFGGGQISVTTIVNLNGSAVSSQTMAQGQSQTGISLARVVKTAVVEELRNQQRSGGLLSGTARA